MENHTRIHPKAISACKFRLLIITGLVLVFGVIIQSGQVHAGKAGNEGYVTAYDYNCVDKVTAPVRYYRGGYQVRVPNWGWTECERSCRLTLRKFHFNNIVDVLNPDKSESDLGILSFCFPIDR